MQTLVFNTTEKSITLYSGHKGCTGTVIVNILQNVPTVKVTPEGFYEVMQRQNEGSNGIPVMRLPIANTNRLIEK
jgi:hypothetical protein